MTTTTRAFPGTPLATRAVIVVIAAVMALLLAGLSALCMLGLHRIESRLPQRPAIGISVRFLPHYNPDEGELRAFLMAHGFDMAMGSISISFSRGSPEWRFVAVAHCRHCGNQAIASSPLF